jgi:hypothetical protein
MASWVDPPAREDGDENAFEEASPETRQLWLPRRGWRPTTTKTSPLPRWGSGFP